VATSDIAKHYAQRREEISDPTGLIIIDETDRLKTASLEQVRDIFDGGGVGVVLLGMPGLEKRLSRYPQLYSRVGFVHAFRPLSTPEVRHLLQDKWLPAGVTLPEHSLSDTEALAAIIRITGGNFRLLHRLLTQIARLVDINDLSSVTKEVVEAARETLVIGAT
jgi:DNA transposition AAA+ family ATPase